MTFDLSIHLDPNKTSHATSWKRRRFFACLYFVRFFFVALTFTLALRLKGFKGLFILEWLLEEIYIIRAPRVDTLGYNTIYSALQRPFFLMTVYTLLHSYNVQVLN